MDAETARLIEERLGRMVYTGNPEHKKYPNDYGLTPPASPPGRARRSVTNQQPSPKRTQRHCSVMESSWA